MTSDNKARSSPAHALYLLLDQHRLNHLPSLLNPVITTTIIEHHRHLRCRHCQLQCSEILYYNCSALLPYIHPLPTSILEDNLPSPLLLIGLLSDTILIFRNHPLVNNRHLVLIVRFSSNCRSTPSHYRVNITLCSCHQQCRFNLSTCMMLVFLHFFDSPLMYPAILISVLCFLDSRY